MNAFRQFSTPCNEVRESLVKQLKEWETNECPKTSESCSQLPCGQKCLYKVWKVNFYMTKLWNDKNSKHTGLFHINRIKKAGFLKLKLPHFILSNVCLNFFQKFIIFILAKYGGFSRISALKCDDSTKTWITFRYVLRGLQTSPHLI